MVTLLASIAGFISSIVPEFIKYLKDVNDKKHELQIFDKQIEYNRFNDNKELEEIYIAQDISEQNSLYNTYYTNIKWVDSLNGSVRPILAYSFFMMYIGVKYMQYCAISTTAHIVQYIDIIWSVDDQAIFAGIISFYYGQRTFRKMWRKD
ncbi:MAG: hypothetical protein DGJ47_000722 [Rickettsiaceae bacterium]